MFRWVLAPPAQQEMAGLPPQVQSLVTERDVMQDMTGEAGHRYSGSGSNASLS